VSESPARRAGGPRRFPGPGRRFRPAFRVSPGPADSDRAGGDSAGPPAPYPSLRRGGPAARGAFRAPGPLLQARPTLTGPGATRPGPGWLGPTRGDSARPVTDPEGPSGPAGGGSESPASHRLHGPGPGAAPGPNQAPARGCPVFSRAGCIS